jgi:hypothetical protein
MVVFPTIDTQDERFSNEWRVLTISSFSEEVLQSNSMMMLVITSRQRKVYDKATLYRP